MSDTTPTAVPPTPQGPPSGPDPRVVRWLVPAQLAAAAAHALPGGPALPVPAVLRPWLRGAGALLLVAGGSLAAASALRLGRDLTPSVTPRAGAPLVTDGLYARSRHPLYAGLLLASAGAVAWRGRVPTLVAAAALAGVLHLKATAEDAVLAERHGRAWQQWAGRVPRLVGVRSLTAPRGVRSSAGAR